MTKIKNSPTSNPETESFERLGLRGPLATFEGTALVPLIRESLAGAGIDPRMYEPSKYGHSNYHGLLVDTIDPSDRQLVDPTLSPIMEAVEKGLHDGTITVSRTPYGTVRLHPWTQYPAEGTPPYEPNADLTAKLDTLGMLQLNDAETGAILGYAPKLNTDGGRPGRVLISVNDVTVGHEPYKN